MIELPSATILAEAAQRWATARDQYRDEAIAVGRLLHRYVVARLEEGNNLNEEKRREVKALRCQAIQDAAVNLCLYRTKVNELIRIAAVVDLLSEGPLGTLSYSALRVFRAVIHRAQRGQPLPRTKKDLQSAACITPAQLEEWSIRPEYRKWAQPLFRQAVAEGWDTYRVGSELAKRSKPRRTRGSIRRNELDDKPILVDLDDLAKVGSPRDLADMITSLIRRCTDPVAVAELIRSRLPTTQRKAS